MIPTVKKIEESIISKSVLYAKEKDLSSFEILVTTGALRGYTHAVAETLYDCLKTVLELSTMKDRYEAMKLIEEGEKLIAKHKAEDKNEN